MSYAPPPGPNENAGRLSEFLNGKLLELGKLYQKKARSNNPKAFTKAIKNLEEEIAIEVPLKKVKNNLHWNAMDNMYRYEYNPLNAPIYRPPKHLENEKNRLEQNLKALQTRRNANRKNLEKKLKNLEAQNKQTNYELNNNNKNNAKKTRKNKKLAKKGWLNWFRG
jgi:hypothetical protein